MKLWHTLAAMTGGELNETKRHRYVQRVQRQLDQAYRTAANRARRERSVPSIGELAAACALLCWARAQVDQEAEDRWLHNSKAWNDIDCGITFSTTEPRANQDWDRCAELAGYAAAAAIVNYETPALLCAVWP